MAPESKYKMAQADFSAYKKLHHTMQITNDRPVYILPLVN